MVMIVVAFFVALYIIFAITYVVLVKIFSKKKRAWLRALIFFLLLPTWDVLIAFIIYIPAALFWSGDTIYEKVKTDTIHYDVYSKPIGVIESTKDELFYNGINYVEMKVSEEALRASWLPKGLYRYWLDKDEKIKYKKISEIGAKYTIKETKSINFVIIPIMFRKRVIIDNQKNRIIASGKSVVVYYLNFFRIPFFNWLRWYDDTGEMVIASNTGFHKINRKVINSY